MPFKKLRSCPICPCPNIINLSQHLIGVHRIAGQERKCLLQGEISGSEVMISEPLLPSTESHIEKHTGLLDMLLCGENLRIELIKKATQGELKAIPELCLNMNEGKLTMPKRNPHLTIVTTLANRNISLMSKKKWMLEYNKILYNIIHPALKEWKRKFRRI